MYANKNILVEINSSRDLRAEERRVWPSQSFGASRAITTCSKRSGLSASTLGLVELRFYSLVMEAVHKTYLDYLSPRCLLKMKLQTLSISSAGATVFIALSFLMAASALPIPPKATPRKAGNTQPPQNHFKTKVFPRKQNPNLQKATPPPPLRKYPPPNDLQRNGLLNPHPPAEPFPPNLILKQSHPLRAPP